MNLELLCWVATGAQRNTYSQRPAATPHTYLSSQCQTSICLPIGEQLTASTINREQVFTTSRCFWLQWIVDAMPISTIDSVYEIDRPRTAASILCEPAFLDNPANTGAALLFGSLPLVPLCQWPYSRDDRQRLATADRSKLSRHRDSNAPWMSFQCYQRLKALGALKELLETSPLKSVRVVSGGNASLTCQSLFRKISSVNPLVVEYVV